MRPAPFRSVLRIRALRVCRIGATGSAGGRRSAVPAPNSPRKARLFRLCRNPSDTTVQARREEAMATSILRDTQTADLARRLDPITSRLWMLRSDAAALPADRLAAEILLAPRASESDDETKLPPIGVAVLLH